MSAVEIEVMCSDLNEHRRRVETRAKMERLFPSLMAALLGHYRKGQGRLLSNQLLLSGVVLPTKRIAKLRRRLKTGAAWASKLGTLLPRCYCRSNIRMFGSLRPNM